MGIFILLMPLIIVGGWIVSKMYQEAHENNIKYEMLYFPNFPRSFKEVSMFFISDIHRRRIADSVIEEVIGIVDMVIIGGDLLEKGVSFQQVKENIQKLKKIGDVYFIWGNNDYEVNTDHLKQLLSEEKVIILDNKAVTFHSEQCEEWSLIGIEDYSMEMDDLESTLKEVKKENFKILLSHNPKIIKEIKEEDQITFVLSGHTHGGQIRIFGFGPYEIGRTKVIGDTTILTSNGYGTTSVSLRLGAKPETHVIKIKNTLDQ
ncbi:metallophosphoesterase [Niallia sp. 01092]|uniref:metallophosphoesterase n=1 Tax=unclassified Niallia TaxID=2837522 RepID=UPI003FD1D9A1